MEKTLKKTLVALCLSIAIVTSLSAQDLSPYWKGRIKLADETFLSMIEIEPQLAISTLTVFALYENENGEMDDLQKLFFKEEILAAAGIGAKYDRVSNFTQYAKNQELKNLFEAYVEKLNALDKTKTAADTEWEKLMKSRQRKGTLSQVIAQVKKEFEKWAAKGDYEKTAQYEQRLNTEGIAMFDSLCRAKSIEVCNKSNYGKVSKSKYDADKESYTYTLTYGDTVLGMHQISSERAIPIGIVSKYSNNDRVNDNRYILEMQVYNGFVLPKEYEFEMMCYDLSDEMYGKQLDNSFVLLTIPEAKEFKICFSDIKFEYSNISNELKQHCFSYSAYRKALQLAKEEGERLIESEIDSLFLLQGQLREQLDRIIKYENEFRLGDSFWGYNSSRETRIIQNWDRDDIKKRLEFTKEKTKEIYLKDTKKYKEQINAIVFFLNRYEKGVLKEVEIKKLNEKLSPIDRNFGTYSKVKDLLCNGSTITFTLPDKTEISGNFRFNEEFGKGIIYVSEQENVLLYIFIGQASFGYGSETKMALIIGENIYRLSSKQVSHLERCAALSR